MSDVRAMLGSVESMSSDKRRVRSMERAMPAKPTLHSQLSERLKLPAVILITALLSVSSATATAQTIMPEDIAPFDVSYEVGNNLINAGSARLSLTNSKGLWQYSLSTKPKGIFKLTGKGRIQETSTFELADVDNGVQIQPQVYAYRQDDERNRSVDATFDWAGDTLTWQRRGEEGTEPLDDKTLDRLTVTLAVMNALRHEFTTLEVPVFDNGRIKTMLFTNEGTVKLDTRLGKIDTVRVRSQNKDGGSRHTNTWFAPSLDYVPVRIEQFKRDELIARLSLKSLSNRITDIELPDLDDESGQSK